MPTPKKAKEEKAPLEGNFVDKKEFDEFREQNTAVQNEMINMLQQALAPKAVAATPEKGSGEVSKPLPSYENQEAGPQENVLPPHYNVLVQKYFNPEDGFKFFLEYPTIDAKGLEVGGYLFTIDVPKKFSNATEAHYKFYKVDLRTRALQAAHMVKGIEEWCQRVARNLNYKKAR